MKRFIAIVIVAAGLMIRPGWTLEETPHVAVGSGRTRDGASLTISADGNALTDWAIIGDLTSGEVPVALDCVWFEWRPTPYPIWPWIPYHVMFASGLGADGRIYHFTVYDRSPVGAGHADLVAITTASEAGPCGASYEAVGLVEGDFVVGA